MSYILNKISMKEYLAVDKRRILLSSAAGCPASRCNLAGQVKRSTIRRIRTRTNAFDRKIYRACDTFFKGLEFLGAHVLVESIHIGQQTLPVGRAGLAATQKSIPQATIGLLSDIGGGS
jgi:hypothetical protein